MEVSGRMSGQKYGAGHSSTEEGEIFCQPCSSDDEWVVAEGYCQNCNEYFCTSCLKLHRKQTVSRHHVVLEGKNMPKSLGPKVDLEACSELCVKHANEIVKFYCSSHDKIGCGDCMILEHKACKVERIQDISTKYFNGPEHTQLAETVVKFLENLVEIRNCIKTAKKDISGTYTKVLADIRQFRKEINNYLDRAEAEIQTEVNRRKDKIDRMVAELAEDQQSLHTEIGDLEEKLKLQSNKANELFVAAKQIKDRMTSLESNIKHMVEKSQIEHYNFEPSSDLKQILSCKIPLGSLKNIIRKEQSEQSEKKIEDMKERFHVEIALKTREDESDCFFIASALISPSQIILADHSNKCLKLVDTEQRKLCTRYILCSEPAGVAVVSRNLVAVTLPDQQKIQFLSLTQKNILTESHDIKMYGKVRKIACQNDNLIIGYTGKVQIINMKGKVSKEISKAGLWIESIVCAHDSKSFYVSNSLPVGKSSVYKFDFDGKLLATYMDETLPNVRGLTVTPDGKVLVCNWTSSGGIHIISPECKKIKEILKHNPHVQRPYCVTFCKETSKLFLCNYFLSLEDNRSNVLKIFQMV